jgi:hypothetical protein
MMKSILAMLCMMFALFATPLVYADEASDDTAASAAQDEPLPPMVDPAVASDTSAE